MSTAKPSCRPTSVARGKSRPRSYSDFLPALSKEEYAALKADIGQRGVVVPVVLDENGNVLDGKHRLEIAEELGIRDVPTQIKVGLDDSGKKAWSLALNIHRRHLTRETRRKLVRQLAKEQRLSTRRIAQTLGVSNVTVWHDLNGAGVKKSTRVIGRDGKQYPSQKHQRTPSVFAQSPSECRKALDLIQSLPTESLPKKNILLRRLGRISREYHARCRERASQTQDVSFNECTILVGDFRVRGSEIADCSADLVFTDPLYHEEHIGLYSDLSAFAFRVLKPGGLLIAYCGTASLREVCRRLDGTNGHNLRHLWTFCSYHGRPRQPYYALRLYSGWKPLVFYCKPPLDVWWRMFPDTCHVPKEKDLHPYQQPQQQAEFFISRLCPPKGLVIDPFLGSGTTLAAAARLGRRAIGIEIDRATATDAQERLRKLVAEKASDAK